MRLPWMSNRDRRRWKAARTTTELGELMALWLEGEIDSRPGYQPRCGPDEETRDLVPVLARLCRAGYITTCSQPGEAGSGWDGAWYEQRAAVEVVLTEQQLLDGLVAAASSAGLTVLINDHSDGGGHDEPVTVTTRDMESVTAFGGRMGRAEMSLQWPGLDRRVRARLDHGVYVSIIAPEYGESGNRLWSVLGDYVTSTMEVSS